MASQVELLTEQTALADQTERKLALNATQSFIVQAPAGSGKTELLTQRFLTLLANAKFPEEIIAITFTRKAAAEMRARILATLHDATTPTATSSLSAHALQRQQLALAVLRQNENANWNLLENPNRLRIQTIDAFCASLTRQLPLLAGFGAQPNIFEEPNLLYREAASAVLAGLETEAPWANTLATLLLHLDNDYRKAQELLSQMLAKRDQWLPYIIGSAQQTNLRNVLEHGLQQAIIDTLHKVFNNIPAHLLAELTELARFAACQLKDHPTSNIRYCIDVAPPKDFLIYLQQLKINPEQLELEKNRWLGIADLLLTKDADEQWRKAVRKTEGFTAPADANNPEEKALFTDMKSRISALLADFSELDELKHSLAAVRLLPPCHYSSAQWEVLTSLIELLPILVAQLQLLFQEQQAVDYLEVAHSALVALGEPHAPTDLALRLDYQIQHILVDEFQDTSVTQFRLLEQLTAGWQPGDGRTLFLVGDPMQSIYRFRKAEVGLFLQAREYGIGNILLTPLTLRVNFRSAPPVVQWVNETFQQLMPKQADVGSGAVTFSHSVANNLPALPGKIHTHSLLADDLNGEAITIAKIIREQLQENPNAHIAILVRARTHLLEILPVLQQENIAYQAVEIETLAQRSVIQDLLALTRALLHPADRIAWLAMLRAPWCGLTLAELQAVVADDAKIAIWDRLLNFAYDTLPSPSKENLTRTIHVLKHSLKHRRRQSLAIWVQGTWLALGGPTSLSNAADLEDTKVFFKLLAKLERGGDLADLTQLENQLTKLYSTPTVTEKTCVEVMTIHKAKGLEFDTVILPGLSRLLAADDQQLLLCMQRPASTGNTDLLLAPVKASHEEQDAIYAYLRHEENTRAAHEVVRLLYVAATRAKHSLHLLATLTEELAVHKNKKPSKNSLLAQLWPSLSASFLAAVPPQPTLSESALDAANFAELQHRRLTSNWQAPALATGLVPQFPDETITLRDKNNTFFWAHNSLRAVGTVVHQLLQQISLDGIAVWKNNIQQKQPQLKALLTRHGVLATELETCTTQVQQALQNVLQDPRGRWLLDQQHNEARSEFALATLETATPVQVIIDRTFVDEHGVRWIIDYKTSSTSQESVEHFLQQEVQQYRPQLEQYAKIMRQIDPKPPIRLGLYFPLLKAWREWSYDEKLKQ